MQGRNRCRTTRSGETRHRRRSEGSDNIHNLLDAEGACVADVENILVPHDKLLGLEETFGIAQVELIDDGYTFRSGAMVGSSQVIEKGG